MRALAAYMAVGAVLVGAVAAVLAGVLMPAASAAVWWAAGLAYAVQTVAFAALVLVRHKRVAFFLAWGVGTLLRFVVVLGAGIWLSRAVPLPPAPLLLSLVGFLFLLLLLEPVFFRVGMRIR